ncbi:MAG TPA: toll/interleukin-1 receptor domain-containing protein [Thermoanaerobaculia bacterium]
MSDKRWPPSRFLLIGVLGAILLTTDVAILRSRDKLFIRPLGSAPLDVSVLPEEELVLEGYAPRLFGDLLLGAEARPNLDLDIRLERARISEDSYPLFRQIVKIEPPHESAQMRYFSRPTTALDQPACRTGFSLHIAPKARTDSLDMRLWSRSPNESNDFRSIVLRSSAALALTAETVTPEATTERDARTGPGCRRVVGVRGTRFEFPAPLAFRFAVPAGQGVFFTFERLGGDPQPWLEREDGFRPFAISPESPLVVRTVLVRKPSGKPGEEAFAAEGEPGSIKVLDLMLASGRLQATLAGEAKIRGSRVLSPGWFAWPGSALGWFALLGILAGHGALLWLGLRIVKVSKEDSMEKVFISYNHADRDWAEWIAWTLEEAGHSVVLDTWDFRPGENFVLEMHKASAGTQRTIVVLSESYLESEYTQPEWAAAFAEDPRGEKRKLIPFRVAPCQPRGLLRAVLYVDLVGLGEEDARLAVLGAFSERTKPSAIPPFPGRKGAAPQPVPFPGPASASVLATALLEGHHERRGPSLTPDERFALMGKLNALPPQQLNMILFALRPPPGLIPPMPAPQGDRVVTLLNWAESPGGCGLGEVQRLLAAVLSAPDGG